MSKAIARQQKHIPAPDPTLGYQMDPQTPLHRLFVRRMRRNRDLKIIITSKDSQTGTGKTTLAFWLASQWQPMFGPGKWQAEEHATLDAHAYLDLYRSMPEGTVLILDEAEDLDARRSMANKNVDFSHYWMKLRVRQVVSVLVLPTNSALDSRLEELADVWIEVQRRGRALCHGITVNSYNKNVQTPKEHQLDWPNVADHPQMQALDKLKEQNIERKIQNETEEVPDPDEVERETRISVAQRMRNEGHTLANIADALDMSQSWVSKYTDPPDEESDDD